MRRHLPDRRTTYLTFLGIVVLLMGLLLIFGQAAVPVLAQESSDRPAPNYIGTDECESCHDGDLWDAHEISAHALTLQQGNDESAIVADFTGEDVPLVQFPGETEARKLTPDDIAYTIGVGRNLQKYLYDLGDNQYAVLPVAWDVQAQAWKPYLADQPWPGPAFDWKTNCAGCHTTDLDIETGEWEEDGVQCEACHGPGGDHYDAADEAGRRASEEEILEIRAAIYNTPDSQMCGQCHSMGTATTGDLPYPADHISVTPLTDSFTLSLPDDEAHWWATGHASHINMQYNEWSASAHATALSTLKAGEYPAEDGCLSCHSADYAFRQRQIAIYEEGDRKDPAPEPASVDNAGFGVTCISCHAPHTLNADNERVAFQTGSDDIYGLCASCHSDANNAVAHHPALEMFEGREIVPNVEAIASSHFTEENGPRCTTCHMPQVPTTDGLERASHTLQPVLPGAAISIEGLQDSCLSCHEEQVNAAQMQQLIDDVQASTRARLDTAAAALKDDTPDWVRTTLNFVEGDGSLGIHNYAYTDALLDAAEAALGLDQPDSGTQGDAGS
ncbi:MAG: hypothetical protein HXY41_09075 [Chloroflexi bacterium]|nr:hypothetical protein [Chloroflexota bacterium]